MRRSISSLIYTKEKRCFESEQHCCYQNYLRFGSVDNFKAVFVIQELSCFVQKRQTLHRLQGDLDEAESLDIGTQYHTDKRAAYFAASIAEAERIRIRKSQNSSKFVSVISDGSIDRSFHE